MYRRFSLSGELLGNLRIKPLHEADMQQALRRAEAAGVRWERRWPTYGADFVLIADGLSLLEQACVVGINGARSIASQRFTQLLDEYEATGTPLRDLLLQHFFAKEVPLKTGATYRFLWSAEGSIQDCLAQVNGAESHMNTGAPYLHVTLNDSNELRSIPTKDVVGQMLHVGSGTKHSAADVAQRALDSGDKWA
jgi:hypothetical protein